MQEGPLQKANNQSKVAHKFDRRFDTRTFLPAESLIELRRVLEHVAECIAGPTAYLARRAFQLPVFKKRTQSQQRVATLIVSLTRTLRRSPLMSPNALSYRAQNLELLKDCIALWHGASGIGNNAQHAFSNSLALDV